MMRRLFACILILGLAACEAKTAMAPPIRDPDARISSQVNVTADRLVGDWVVRVSWPGVPNVLDYNVHRLKDTKSDDSTHTMKVQSVRDTLNLSGVEARAVGADEVRITPFETRLSVLGQGRFRPVAGTRFDDADLWVLWMDADDRTVAIGTPGGSFGWIMDRQPTGGEDRITAAKDIMEWMGYDLSLARE